MCLQPSCDPAETAAAALTEILNMPDLKAADEEILRIPTGPTGVPSTAKIARMVGQYRSGPHRLDLAKASPRRSWPLALPLR